MAKKENRHAEHFDKLSASLVSASANIEAPYELPEGWEWVTIVDCCEKAFSGKSPKYSKEITPYKIIGQQANQRYGIDLTFIKYGTKEFAEAQQDFYYLQYNDVLLNTLGTGSIGRSGIYKYDEKILTDGHPFVFRTEKKYVADLLFYYLRLNEQEIINTANGSTNQKFLSLKTFLKFPIPLPPTLAEQQRIVNRIETMFAKLDQAQEKAQSVLDSFEPRKAAILHKAFTGQLKIDNEELTIENWEEKKLEDVLIEKPRNGYSTTAVDYETPYKTMSLSATTSGYFRPEFYKYIEADISDDSFLWLKPGDILIQRANSLDKVGTSAIYTGEEHEFIYPDLMMKLQVKESVSNAFIVYQLKTEESLAYFRNNATGTAGNMPKINQKTVCNLPIKLPPLNYQLSIVNFLDTVLEKESRAKESASTVLDQIALLKKSILARAFRGEL